MNRLEQEKIDNQIFSQALTTALVDSTPHGAPLRA
jgi:hypothetical protein